MQLVPGSHRIIADADSDPVAGAIFWSPGKSLWIGMMTAAALFLGPLYFTWDAFALFLLTSAITLCAGHSIGMHRRLIHNSFNGLNVLTQPPAMHETSPFGNIHTPHIEGYFETGETRFELKPLGDRKTRLTIRAAHRLQIDPLFYWEPIARWAIKGNTGRVLRDMKAKAES